MHLCARSNHQLLVFALARINHSKTAPTPCSSGQFSLTPPRRQAVPQQLCSSSKAYGVIHGTLPTPAACSAGTRHNSCIIPHTSRGARRTGTGPPVPSWHPHCRCGFRVRHTTAVPRLGVRLVLDLPVAPGWPCTAERTLHEHSSPKHRTLVHAQRISATMTPVKLQGGHRILTASHGGPVKFLRIHSGEGGWALVQRTCLMVYLPIVVTWR